LTSSILTRDEREILGHFESVIELNFRNFMNAGSALAAIRDADLFREGYASLEEYARDRWNLGHAPEDEATEPTPTEESENDTESICWY